MESNTFVHPILQIPCNNFYKKHPLEIIDDGQSIKIPCRNKKHQVTRYTIISIENKEFVKYTFSAHYRRAQDHHKKKYYVICSNKSKLHHMVCPNNNPKMVVDHIDGDSLNNRISNLKIVTFSQNAQNKPSRRGSTSKYIGVYEIKPGVWRASLRAKHLNNGKTINLGQFPTQEEAYHRYMFYVLYYIGNNYNDYFDQQIVEIYSLGHEKNIPIPLEFMRGSYFDRDLPGNIDNRKGKFSVRSVLTGSELMFESLEDALIAKYLIYKESHKLYTYTLDEMMIDWNKCVKFYTERGMPTKMNNHPNLLSNAHRCLGFYQSKIIDLALDRRLEFEFLYTQLLKESNVMLTENNIPYIEVNSNSGSLEREKCLVDYKLWPLLNLIKWNTHLNYVAGYIPLDVSILNHNFITIILPQINHDADLADHSKRQNSMHRFIWELLYGEIPEGYSIDHINGNILDNRIQNLRCVTRGVQGHNRDKWVFSFHDMKGVNISKWQFKLNLELNKGDTRRFNTMEKAAEAVNYESYKKYGSHANLIDYDKTKETTVRDLMDRTVITPELIQQIKPLEHILFLIRMLKLNNQQGGPILIDKIRQKHVEEYKRYLLNYISMNDVNVRPIIPTDEEIMNIRTVKELEDVVRTFNMYPNAGGDIVIRKIKTSTLKEYKIKVITALKKKRESFQIFYQNLNKLSNR